MIDPITWGQDVQKNNSTCLHNFDRFAGEIKKMYGEKDWRLKAARKSLYDYQQDDNGICFLFVCLFFSCKRRCSPEGLRLERE